MDYDDPYHKHKFRLPLCLTCFSQNPNPHQALKPQPESPKLLRSISAGLRSKAQEKCRNLFCRGSRGRRSRRHSSSADFRYDPWSYSMNFDKGAGHDDENDSPLRNFSSRLPLSPLGSPQSAKCFPDSPLDSPQLEKSVKANIAAII